MKKVIISKNCFGLEPLSSASTLHPLGNRKRAFQPLYIVSKDIAIPLTSLEDTKYLML